jgi:hypothetical protein
MQAQSIRVLKPHLSRQAALQIFTKAGPASLFWRLRGGRLSRIADVYVPYTLYQVCYLSDRTHHSRIFALDAMSGTLDLVEFPSIPTDGELAEILTRNSLPRSLPEQRAAHVVREKVLRLIFQQGFFKLRQPSLELVRDPLDVYIPYWLGFYGGQTVRCRVLNAVRCSAEGSKASAFFEEWLAA